MDVVPFEARFGAEVAELIVGIQRGEFSIDITVEHQPDLGEIPAFYQVGSGDFWVAVAAERVVGTIALLDIGNRQGALRKMFVHLGFRGGRTGTAARLLRALFGWARAHEIEEVFLGTISKFHAARRFYAKNGFEQIPRAALPPGFPVMTVDDEFYRRRVDVGGPQEAAAESSERA